MNLSVKPDLQGKVAVITGGAGVLCSEFARALAQCGAKVAILNRTLSKAEALAEEIRAAGYEAIGVAVNVTDADSVKAAHEEVLRIYGKCDILINGAGGNHPSASTTKEYFEPGDIEDDVKSFFDIDEEGFRYVLDLNFAGTMLPTQAFARDMVGREGCTIINVSSMNAFTPLTKIPAYSGAKAAISNFTQWLAVHFSKVGIRCNAIAPGFFLTAQNYALMYREDGTPTERSGKIIAGTPMGRFGKPEELVGTLLFLVDEQASGFVNGVVIPVDGGFSAYSGV
ncbi:MAG: SDR family oxidoreductase [Oscillospiraceae bacterium]|nr:SDR family oxidoreductase [Oscillospiraceae bacterium]